MCMAYHIEQKNLIVTLWWSKVFCCQHGSNCEKRVNAVSQEQVFEVTSHFVSVCTRLSARILLFFVKAQDYLRSAEV